MRDISARELKGHNILAVERFWAVSYTHLSLPFRSGGLSAAVSRKGMESVLDP